MKFRMLVCLTILTMLSFLSASGLVHAQVGCCDQVSNGCAGNVIGCDNGCINGCAAGCDNGCANGCGAVSCCDSGCCDRCGHYVSVFGGWTDWTNLDANGTANANLGGGLGGPLGGVLSGTASLDIQTKDGFAVGSAFGRYINYNLRSEFEFAYRNNSLENLTASATQLGAATADLDGKINTFSGMYNLYYDLGSVGQMGLRPYVGGGLGFAFLNFDVRSPALPGVALGVETSAFAYQGMVGVTYQLSNQIDLFTEYRLFGTDDLVKATISAPAVPANVSADLGGGFTHNIFVGARISIR